MHSYFLRLAKSGTLAFSLNSTELPQHELFLKCFKTRSTTSPTHRTIVTRLAGSIIHKPRKSAAAQFTEHFTALGWPVFVAEVAAGRMRAAVPATLCRFVFRLVCLLRQAALFVVVYRCVLICQIGAQLIEPHALERAQGISVADLARLQHLDPTVWVLEDLVCVVAGTDTVISILFKVIHMGVKSAGRVEKSRTYVDFVCVVADQLVNVSGLIWHVFPWNFIACRKRTMRKFTHLFSVKVYDI